MNTESQTLYDADVEDTPLQAAVWLVEALGISMPPIPHVYVDKIEELSTGQVFGTRSDLANLTAPSELERVLDAEDWPVAGLAFGFRPASGGGIWFYTLVSEQILIQISLRIRFTSQDDIESGKSQVSLAHHLLERFMSNEINYFRTISALPKGDGIPREILSYSNETGTPIERVATWNGRKTLSAFRPSTTVFGSAASVFAEEPLLIFK